MEHEFNPFHENPLYRRHRARWQLETDAAEMTLDVLGLSLIHISEPTRPY